MKEVLMLNEDIFSHPSVERNKAASQICKRLFPQWSKPPFQGELQRIIIESKRIGGNEKQIFLAGNWWLWIRELFIENAISSQEKIQIMCRAIDASLGKKPVHFVSARSPEMLHKQVSFQRDLSLPRSRMAVAKLTEVTANSRKLLPTKLTILFADLAIDNFDNINETCDLEKTIELNLARLSEICQELGAKEFQILRMSNLSHPNGKLGDILNFNGSPKIPVILKAEQEHLIRIVTKESVESHKRMFGWSEEESFAHNRNLGVTMGLVGQAARMLEPSPIMIHNEAFISRGRLNNLFNDPKNPLPVICLRDLLENKISKKLK